MNMSLLTTYYLMIMRVLPVFHEYLEFLRSPVRAALGVHGYLQLDNRINLYPDKGIHAFAMLAEIAI